MRWKAKANEPDRRGQFAALQDEIRSLRRETAELRAAQDAALDLALIHAVPNAVLKSINEARDAGWALDYQRSDGRDLYGTIRLCHPTENAHDYSIRLPLPHDLTAHRTMQAAITMRIRGSQAA